MVSEYVAIDSLPFRGYLYMKYWDKDSLTRYYCIPQTNHVYIVWLKRLKENNFLWNPKYLNKELLP